MKLLTVQSYYSNICIKLLKILITWLTEPDKLKYIANWYEWSGSVECTSAAQSVRVVSKRGHNTFNLLIRPVYSQTSCCALIIKQISKLTKCAFDQKLDLTSNCHHHITDKLLIHNLRHNFIFWIERILFCSVMIV